MNQLTARPFPHTAWRLAVLCAVILAAGVQAADPPQPARFLLIFETSPAIKKNLSTVRQILVKLFATNLQNEIQSDDDLAVWTVDQNLRYGAFPLASWSPSDSEMYSQRLDDFLDHQKYTRHASLAALQPLLNRVVKNSDRLTVVIFCDTQSRLLGTPYDAGVNEIITNNYSAAKIKGGPLPFILVLRAYHGEYLGCSVNRGSPLNFPKFPPPPAPPVAATSIPPAPVAKPGPVVAPISALIIVGTNAATNVAAAARQTPSPTATPPPEPGPVPGATPVVAPAMAATSPATGATVPPPPAPVIVPAPPSSPVPVLTPPPAPQPPATPAPAPVPVPPKTLPPPTATTAATTTVRSPVNPPVAPPIQAAAPAPGNSGADTGSQWPLIIAGAALLGAAALVIWLVIRARRPRSSLITTSMQNDPNRHPRK